MRTSQRGYTDNMKSLGRTHAHTFISPLPKSLSLLPAAQSTTTTPKAPELRSLCLLACCLSRGSILGVDGDTSDNRSVRSSATTTTSSPPILPFVGHVVCAFAQLPTVPDSNPVPVPPRLPPRVPTGPVLVRSSQPQLHDDRRDHPWCRYPRTRH